MLPRWHEGSDGFNPKVLASELHTGTEREAPRPPRARVPKRAQKPGPTSARRVKKSGNSARGTAVLARLRCASSAKQRRRHSGVSELILSSLPVLQPSCLSGSDASCSLTPAASGITRLRQHILLQTLSNPFSLPMGDPQTLAGAAYNILNPGNSLGPNKKLLKTQK